MVAASWDTLMPKTSHWATCGRIWWIIRILASYIAPVNHLTCKLEKRTLPLPKILRFCCVQDCCVQVHSDFIQFSTAIRFDEIYKLIGILSGVGAEDYLFACSINFYYRTFESSATTSLCLHQSLHLYRSATTVGISLLVGVDYYSHCFCDSKLCMAWRL